MLYVYRRAVSTGARLLTEALKQAGVEAKRVRRLPRLAGSDRVLAWGETHKGALNGDAPIRSKITDAAILLKAGVPTVEVSATFREGWLGRSRNHTCGDDLLVPPTRPDYWVRKLDIVEEYRVHMFHELSIRAGRKIPRDGAHSWIRSLQSGWWISYDGKGIKQKHRELAKKAVKALGLDFGAVDLAKLKDGTLIVLEVNRAPGVEGNSITAYVNAIQKWVGGN